MEDFSLHPSVRYSHFEKTKELSFIPCDGYFELMQFTMTNNQATEDLLPIAVSPKLGFKEREAIIEFSIRNNLDSLEIGDFSLDLPLPSTISSDASISCSVSTNYESWIEQRNQASFVN